MTRQNLKTKRSNILTMPVSVLQHGALWATHPPARRSVAVPDIGAHEYVRVGMNDALARRVTLRGASSINRWYGYNLSECLGPAEADAVPPKRTVSWDRVLGLATMLAVSGVAWAVVAIVLSDFLR